MSWMDFTVVDRDMMNYECGIMNYEILGDGGLGALLAVLGELDDCL